ncbi:tyrosinase-like [Anarrhichthys ocellatus]|uniref:tyrosinase-like n=1 Tax=Anarrhichthys ocellatus TaxID=433405 RepID=UPI0012EE13E1|nr:tyrosinase-like [Anarrhichthys ocellatus]
MLLLLHWFWLVLVLYLTNPGEVEAQFPRPCTTPEARKDRTCCPLFNGSICGSSLGRGVCVKLPQIHPSRPVDYRVGWHRYFFNSACMCLGNYDGFDCSQCLPGFRGPQCEEPHVIERKEITDMTDSERETFLSSLHQAKQSHSSRYMILSSNDTTVEGNYEFHNSTVYDVYVWMHDYAAKTIPVQDIHSAHQGPAFVFWHRLFLLFIEREIRELTGNQDFYIPYWDWTRTDHCNICTNKYLGAVGKYGRIHNASLFSNWTITCLFRRDASIICDPSNENDPKYLIRNPGRDTRYKTLPTTKDVEDTLAIPDYDTPPYDKTSNNSFRNTLEGYKSPDDPRHSKTSMHKLAHHYLLGTVTQEFTAANDPLSLVLHSFLDKIFEDWFKDHPNATYPDSDEVTPAQRAKAFMAPFFPLRTNDYFWNKPIQDLGYSYREHSLPHSGAGSRPAR